MNITWNIGRKLTIALGLVLLIQLLVSTLAYLSFTKLNENNDLLMLTEKTLGNLASLLSNMQDIEIGQRGYIISGNEGYLKPYHEGLNGIDKDMAKLHELITSPVQQKRLEMLKPLIAAKLEFVKRTIDLRRNDAKAAFEIVGTGIGKQSMEAFRAALEEIHKEEVDLQVRRSTAAAATTQSSLWTILLGGIVATTFTLLAAVFLTRSIVYPITGIASIARQIADGDLTANISSSQSRDEIGVLAQAIRQMVENLRSMLDETSRMAEKNSQAADLLREMLNKALVFVESVAQGDLSKKISLHGSDDLERLGKALNSMTESLAGVAFGTTEAINTIYSALEEFQSSINGQSAGASEQASAVNQTSASLDEIKAMAAQTTEKVQLLGETAERSRRESEQGSAAVEQAIAGMSAIRTRVEGIAQTILALSEQTQQIGEITAVVTNIAQQSKMLALNASIEAAKAGEAGKGFAVVAAEVRELAEQSQQSTAQVQKILQDIRHATDRAVMATEEGGKGVNAGMISVQKSGEVMGQLGEVVRETAMASQQISAVVRQQFIGLEQVTQAMKEINKVTSQFVSSTQQSKEASAGLRRVAERLRDSVKIYKL